MKTLEKRNFVATEADIESLVSAHDTALVARDTARATYLKALTATTTIAELNAPVRLRAERRENDVDRARHCQGGNAMLISRNSKTVGEATMNGFSPATIDAMALALAVYDAVAADPVTASAAYGLACGVLMDALDVNLRTAALLLDAAIGAREAS